MKAWTLIILLALTLVTHFVFKLAAFKDRGANRAHQMMMELARQGRIEQLMPRPKHKMENP